MRIANTNTVPRGADPGEEIVLMTNISFTGNAINYLSAVNPRINLKEWIWHEQLINGKKHFVITDKVINER